MADADAGAVTFKPLLDNVSAFWDVSGPLRTAGRQGEPVTTTSLDPAEVRSFPSEADATRVLNRAHRWTRSYPWWGDRLTDGWLLRFPAGPAPADAPCWIVLDDGSVIPVHRKDTLGRARYRALHEAA